MKSEVPFAGMPYLGQKQQLILRDFLAIDRTRLANERTLLAWLRTALMLLVSGITVIKLFAGELPAEVLGGALIPIALGMAVLGVRRYVLTRANIGAVDDASVGVREAV